MRSRNFGIFRSFSISLDWRSIYLFISDRENYAILGLQLGEISPMSIPRTARTNAR